MRLEEMSRLLRIAERRERAPYLRLVSTSDQAHYERVVVERKTMATSLMASLPARIQKLEAKYGSDNPYVKDLKEQLRAMKENDGKTTQDVYRLQAMNFSSNKK